MRKPSNKWLTVSLVVIMIVTLVGIVMTAFTYHTTQKNALKMGMNQLVKINDLAIDVLNLEIEAYSASLSNYALSLTSDQVLKRDFSMEHQLTRSASVGIYLFAPDGTLVDGLDYQAGHFKDATSVPSFIAKDPLFQEALQGSVQQNGRSYFAQDQAYLNLYQVVKKQGQPVGLIVLPIKLETLYTALFSERDQFNGYTMVKNRDMKVIMHPSKAQIGLSIVEDRRQKYPNLDYSDLEDLEKLQQTTTEGTESYYSYWWTQAEPTRVFKLTAYRWISIGGARWIIATNSDFYEQNGRMLLDNLLLSGLFLILLAILFLLSLSIRSYARRNESYLENARLIERQKIADERHMIEKNMLQESKLETIGLLTTTIVHDMNNFLTPMIGNLELLLDEYQENPELSDDLHEIYQAAKKGQQLSANVLRFSRVATQHKEKTSVTEAVQEAVKTMQILIPKSAILSYASQADGLALFDREELQVILYNLITNAYQSKDSAVHIAVTVKIADKKEYKRFKAKSLFSRAEYFILIQISDDGPGIPPEIEKEIFSPFFTTKKATGGTGLGLFIVASIIKKNDWLLTVETSEKGSTFLIGIPLLTE